jgi:hypothetical protein
LCQYICFFCSTQHGRILLKDSDEFKDASDDFVVDAKPYLDRVENGAYIDKDDDDMDGIEMPQIAQIFSLFSHIF